MLFLRCQDHIVGLQEVGCSMVRILYRVPWSCGQLTSAVLAGDTRDMDGGVGVEITSTINYLTKSKCGTHMKTPNVAIAINNA